MALRQAECMKEIFPHLEPATNFINNYGPVLIKAINK